MTLTAHTRRAVVSGVVLAGLAGGYDLMYDTALLADHSAALVAIATGIVWLASAVEAVAKGMPKVIARLVREQARSHPIRFYRAFVNRLMRPCAGVIGYLVPISQLMVALSYFSGILVPAAAVGALVLLLNILVFQRVTRLRDDFALLVPLQVLILVTAPGGIPEIVSAMTP